MELLNKHFDIIKDVIKQRKEIFDKFEMQHISDKPLHDWRNTYWTHDKQILYYSDKQFTLDTMFTDSEVYNTTLLSLDYYEYEYYRLLMIGADGQYIILDKRKCIRDGVGDKDNSWITEGFLWNT